MRKTFLAVITALLVAVGGAAAALYLYNRPTVLRVAVPKMAEDTRLMTAIAQELSRQHEKIRLRLVPVPDSAAGGKALESEDADLAVMRSDIALPANVQTLVILRRNAVLLVAPGGSKLKRVADLAGKKIGIVHEVSSVEPNAHLLETILVQYDMSLKRVTLVPLAPEDVREAVAAGKVDAIFAVAVPQRGLAKDIVGAVAEASVKPPVFLPITEAKAIAKRSPALEPMEVLQGAFGGDPPRPAEAIDGLGISVLLTARESLKDSLASELTRLLLVHRGAIAAAAPLAASIEPPSTEKGAAVPVHQGAADYLEGNEKSFFDKYSDMIYIGAMLLSVIGSGAAAIASRYVSKAHPPTEALTDRMLEILQAARAGASAAELDDYEREIDEAVVKALADRGLSGDPPGLQVAGLALDQTRRAIKARRQQLAKEGLVVSFRREASGE